jgi:quercetin dioxygenase-like cupin family protein
MSDRNLSAGDGGSMKYIHTPEDLKGTFTGWGDDTIPGLPHEEEGYSTALAVAEELADKVDLNEFTTRRLIVGVHTWPPGKDHGSHHHPRWEQCYYIFAGQAEITVGEEKKIVGPGGSAYMPPGVEHNIMATGDETLVAAVVAVVLDEDELG